MLRTSIATTAVALGTVLATGVAVATPPLGFATFDTIARGPAVGATTVNVAPGTGAYLGSYALAPGSSTGWRAQPGTSMLAVTSGTVRVVQAEGCVAREYTAPEIAVLPAGTVHVSNTGGGPVEFVGYFDGLGKAIGKPLVEGRAARAPKGCATAAYRAASAGVTALELASGVWRPIALQPAQHHIAAARAKVPTGADVQMLFVDHIAPGTSTGWYRHAPGIAFLIKGKSETWVATDTGCAKVEENVAGDAISHVHHDLHVTRISADSEPATAILLYWGMGNDRARKPGILNFAEANDFTPMPPPGCTTF